MIDKTGIYTISNEEYHSDCCVKPCLSRGTIMDLLFKSPAHAIVNHPHFYKQEDGNDKKYSIGQAAHSLFLEGIDKACVIDADDWRKKETKEQRDQAYTEGKIPLLIKQYEEINDMVSTANKALLESELETTIETGIPEESIFWKEGETWFKVRMDWYDNDIILDYKTSESANPEDFVRKVLSLGYDVQDALYSRGYEEHFHPPRSPRFIFMVQEITKPYLCSFISLSPEFKDMGRKKVNQGIALWKNCLSTNEWPGYPNRICYIDPPPWAANWQMRANINEGEEI